MKKIILHKVWSKVIGVEESESVVGLIIFEPISNELISNH